MLPLTLTQFYYNIYFSNVNRFFRVFHKKFSERGEFGEKVPSTEKAEAPYKRRIRFSIKQKDYLRSKLSQQVHFASSQEQVLPTWIFVSVQ